MLITAMSAPQGKAHLWNDILAALAGSALRATALGVLQRQHKQHQTAKEAVNTSNGYRSSAVRFGSGSGYRRGADKTAEA